jgi:hypothetical protein
MKMSLKILGEKIGKQICSMQLHVSIAASYLMKKLNLGNLACFFIFGVLLIYI